MDRLSHAPTPPLRLLERRPARAAPAAVPAQPSAPGERLQAWLRRFVPGR